MKKIDCSVRERVRGMASAFSRQITVFFPSNPSQLALVLILFLAGGSASASGQVSVLTEHNDIARTGQNTNETILTPSNVNSTQFGKLFSQPVSGAVLSQPLYVPQVTIPGKGIHNVLYVATGSYINGIPQTVTGDIIYAFDADTNGGLNATPLWQTSLQNNSTPGTAYQWELGVIGTPVIDPSTNTMYLVSAEVQNGSDVHRLHALDITTGAEKFGAPIQIHASVPGTGSGSTNSVVTLDDESHLQRPGLLLVNGVLYVAFGSVADQGAWHGWILSYNAATLQQIDVFCTSANGSGAGIWMGGAALAAEVYDSAKPYGRMFLATGNGSYTASYPYNNTMSYGMSVLDLDLTGGVMTVEDEFTPFNQALLDGEDGDLGSGGPVLLPHQVLASGKILRPLIQDREIRHDLHPRSR